MSADSSTPRPSSPLSRETFPSKTARPSSNLLTEHEPNLNTSKQDKIKTFDETWGSLSKSDEEPAYNNHKPGFVSRDLPAHFPVNESNTPASAGGFFGGGSRRSRHNYDFDDSEEDVTPRGRTVKPRISAAVHTTSRDTTQLASAKDIAAHINPAEIARHISAKEIGRNIVLPADAQLSPGALAQVIDLLKTYGVNLQQTEPMPDGMVSVRLTNFHHGRQATVTVYGLDTELSAFEHFVVRRGGKVNSAHLSGVNCAFYALEASLAPYLSGKLSWSDIKAMITTPTWAAEVKKFVLARDDCGDYNSPKYHGVISEMCHTDNIGKLAMQLLLHTIGESEKKNFRLIIVGYSSRHRAYLVEAQDSVLNTKVSSSSTVQPVYILSENMAQGDDRNFPTHVQGFSGMTLPKPVAKLLPGPPATTRNTPSRPQSREGMRAPVPRVQSEIKSKKHTSSTLGSSGKAYDATQASSSKSQPRVGSATSSWRNFWSGSKEGPKPSSIDRGQANTRSTSSASTATVVRQSPGGRAESEEGGQHQEPGKFF